MPSASPSRNVSGNNASNIDRSSMSIKEEGRVDPMLEGTKSLSGGGDNAVSSPRSTSRPSTAAESHAGTAPVVMTQGVHDTDRKVDVPVLDLLGYIRSTFDDESVLDSIPLEAAGNPSAWHAWRSHRKASDPGLNRMGVLSPDSAKSRRNNPQARPPGEWNWEGVWAKRSQDNVQGSFLESVLFGTSGRGVGDELVSAPFPYG